MPRTSTNQTDSRLILEACKIPLAADFHTLSTTQVSDLLDYADRQKYRKPKNANGSRGRYFHALIQRRAR